MKTRQDAWTEENDLLLAETVLRHVREGSTQLNAFEEVGDSLNRTSAACGFRWNAVVRHNYEKALQLAKKQRKQRQRLLGQEHGGKKKLLYQPPTPSFDEMDASAEYGEEWEAYDYEQGASSPLPSPPPEATPHSEEVDKSENEQPYEPFASEPEEPIVERAQASEMVRTEQPVPTTPATLTLDHVVRYLQGMKNSNFHVDVLKRENERLKREVHTLVGENERLQARVKDLESDSYTMQEDYETLMKIMNRARKYVVFEDDEKQPTKFKMDRNGNLEKVAE
ncbi:RsfA family transcriptional regulator [Bacillus fonticola]|uniref:RsfA family transcriptional regulator n=1 Tax=Bacillus fonticola TaxID=2728853 RepID=UPI001474FDAE|nr:RsfA family transcriptional regulator [Bacillus fonticola]